MQLSGGLGGGERGRLAQYSDRWEITHLQRRGGGGGIDIIIRKSGLSEVRSSGAIQADLYSISGIFVCHTL